MTPSPPTVGERKHLPAFEPHPEVREVKARGEGGGSNNACCGGGCGTLLVYCWLNGENHKNTLVSFNPHKDLLCPHPSGIINVFALSSHLKYLQIKRSPQEFKCCKRTLEFF